MCLYQRYIIRQLLYSLLLVTFSLTSIVWLTQALRFLDFIIDQGMSIAAFLQLTSLLVPSLLMMILPAAMFAATVFTYHKLKADSELVVLQSTGLSKWRLALPGLAVAAMFTLCNYALSLYIMPASYSKFKDMQVFFRNNYASISLQEGVFATPTSGLTVFIRERASNGALRGILVHDSREEGKPVTMMAEQGHVVQSENGPQFELVNGNRQEMQEGKLSFLNFAHYTLDLSLYGEGMKPRVPENAEMPLNQLLASNPALSPTAQNKRVSEGHQRIVWPAYVFCLTAVALAIQLSGEFNRRGAWRRVAVTVVAATLLLLAAIGLRGAAAQHPILIPLIYLNLLAPLAASLFNLRWWPLSPLHRLHSLRA